METVIITGGLGFLGQALAKRLLAERPDLQCLRLVDQKPVEAANSLLADPRVEMVVGDLTSTGTIDRSVVSADWTDRSSPTVYHLASVVSAGAEADFDLGYGVNLLGSLALLERCRQLAAAAGSASTPARLVFSSSVATFGPDAGRSVDDATAQRPETSYGTQKACVELLINDYHRRGFINGWSLRLPTVAVRPGAPNRAASGFASSIIREPLTGVDVVCPVAADTEIAVISPWRVVDALVKILDLEPSAIGADRTVMLPGIPMRAADAVDAVRASGAERQLGQVHFEADPEVQRIVDSWPTSIVGGRADALGMGGDQSVAAIVRQHIDDELPRSDRLR